MLEAVVLDRGNCDLINPKMRFSPPVFPMMIETKFFKLSTFYPIPRFEAYKK